MQTTWERKYNSYFEQEFKEIIVNFFKQNFKTPSFDEVIKECSIPKEAMGNYLKEILLKLLSEFELIKEEYIPFKTKVIQIIEDFCLNSDKIPSVEEIVSFCEHSFKRNIEVNEKSLIEHLLKTKTIERKKISLKIAEEIKQEKLEEGYYIYAELSWGDYDFHDHFHMGPFKNQDLHHLEEVLKILEMLEHKLRSQYNEVPKFNLWFDDIGIGIKENDPRYEFALRSRFFTETLNKRDNYRNWGWKRFQGHNYSLENYFVYYVNDLGEKNRVKVE